MSILSGFNNSQVVALEKFLDKYDRALDSLYERGASVFKELDNFNGKVCIMNIM